LHKFLTLLVSSCPASSTPDSVSLSSSHDKNESKQKKGSSSRTASIFKRRDACVLVQVHGAAVPQNLLPCASLYCTLQSSLFLQPEGLQQPCIEPSCTGAVCQTAFVRVSVTFWEFCISKFFIIFILVMVICNQCSLMLLL